MGRVGFIQDKLEIKFLILYVAARLIEPVPFEAMQELTMCDDGIDFFDFSECLSNLVESQHLTLSDDGLYAITEKGLHNGAICESSLPYSVRLRADKNITIFNQKLKRRAQIQSDIAPRRNGTYTVTLAFNDDESQPILKMELMVPKEVMAKERHRYFPVLDDDGHYIGVVSRRNMMNLHKKQLILVDHNEKGQAVEGLSLFCFNPRFSPPASHAAVLRPGCRRASRARRDSTCWGRMCRSPTC